MIRVTFACGHTVELPPTANKAVCPCGETRHTRVTAPPPRFRGTVRGPTATTVDLAPIRLSLVDHTKETA